MKQHPGLKSHQNMINIPMVEVKEQDTTLLEYQYLGTYT